MYKWLLFIGYVYGKDVFIVGLDYYFYLIIGEIVKYNFIIVNSSINVYNFFSGKFMVVLDGIYIVYYYGFVLKN